MNIKGQGQSLTLDQGHSDSIFLNFFSSITTRLFEAKFHMEPSWDRGTKACSNGPGHLTKVAAMPIYGKVSLLAGDIGYSPGQESDSENLSSGLNDMLLKDKESIREMPNG